MILVFVGGAFLSRYVVAAALLCGLLWRDSNPAATTTIGGKNKFERNKLAYQPAAIPLAANFRRLG